MPDPEGVRLVTVSWDDEEGLEVDWSGMNEYEAFGLLWFAVETVRELIEGTEDD